jgi:YHS domain-containing protein
MRSLTNGFRFTLFALLFAARMAAAGEFFEADGAALHGYDPVSYFDAGMPTSGKPQYVYTYKGSNFRFASAENRNKFIADPEKYAPQYGGFCALGTANGYKVSTQPDAFKVVDGKLYLNHDRKVLDIWKQDIPGNVTRADANWPETAKMELKQ